MAAGPRLVDAGTILLEQTAFGLGSVSVERVRRLDDRPNVPAGYWATMSRENVDLVLVRDYGRREPGGPEVEQIDAAMWTVREGKIARAELYTDRAEALNAGELADG